MTARMLLSGGHVLIGPGQGQVPPYRADHLDIMIEDGLIVEVAAGIQADGCEVLDATGTLVIPGFVDTHRHNWQAAFRSIASDWTLGQYAHALHGIVKHHMTPDDMYIAVLAGRLEALASGVTTMVDWAHGISSPAHADAVLRALQDSKARSVFAYAGGWGLSSDVPITEEVTRMAAAVHDLDDDLLTMALGLRGPQYSSMETTTTDVRTARSLGIPVTVHAGSAAWGTNRPIGQMHEAGLLDGTTTVVHGNTLTEDEIAMIADVGASASVSAGAEIQMGFGWPATGRFLAAGVRPSLSIDDCAAIGGDMFRAMSATLLAERGVTGARDPNTADRRSLPLDSADVFEFATARGAEACVLKHPAGSIRPGHHADLVILDVRDLAVAPLNHPVGAVVGSGHPGLVRDVLVGGQVVKSNGRLVGVDAERMVDDLVASRDAICKRIEASTGQKVALDGSWTPPVTGFASTDGPAAAQNTPSSD
ncbi:MULTISPECIES: amidohydrolase family protein [Actinomadura]|uniref:Cytosine/adenosine deaminase n=1 Tax=Actinomadura madurae TaxID=1993 RepID=A0A1I5NF53_9ACTN|nr:amidohydrolase family protein [Actinomadura madurae]SFP20357.1 Cytosine/adenosine deaminase [Actinomadura madurae]SPT50179.1 5-methylthioadenosine/S-adenosylhomocysteine deaminase [Actinomadura madurae]